MIHPLQPYSSIYTPDSSQAKVALALLGLLMCTTTTVAVGLIFKFQLFKSGLGEGLIATFVILGFLIICAVSMRALHNAAHTTPPPFKPAFTIEEV